MMEVMLWLVVQDIEMGVMGPASFLADTTDLGAHRCLVMGRQMVNPRGHSS